MSGHFIFILVILPIVTEALTQLIGYSEIFEKTRAWIKKRGKFFDKLFSCKYCLSVWMAAFVSIGFFMSGSIVWQSLPYYLIAILLVHRLSNIYHLIFDIVNEYKLYKWSIMIGSVEE
jgi:hypothetical protein